MTTFFTADHHFGHRSIINMCNRPFASVEEMDETMIALWNGVVGKKDDVYHLGDFAYRCDPERLKKIFARLNGRKRLVLGNHDKKWTRELPWHEPPEYMRFIKVGDQKQKVVLCHYGMRVWPGNFRGALHFYGHSHTKLPGNNRSLDVGVDHWNFTPVSLDQIKLRLAELPEYYCEGELPDEPEDEADVENAAGFRP